MLSYLAPVPNIFSNKTLSTYIQITKLNLIYYNIYCNYHNIKLNSDPFFPHKKGFLFNFLCKNIFERHWLLLFHPNATLFKGISLCCESSFIASIKTIPAIVTVSANVPKSSLHCRTPVGVVYGHIVRTYLTW